MPDQQQRAEVSPLTESNGEVQLTLSQTKLSIDHVPLTAEVLKDFYKECGREVTLAYTTLNQMKNWAMVVAAAAISGLSFSTSAQQYPNPVMFVGVVIVYTFILRFFVRAIICYINLSRWNILQFDYINLLQAEESKEQAKIESAQQEIAKHVNDYYTRWLSPLGRRRQVYSTLKLGFALLFALPLFFIGWGIVGLWSSALVKGFTVFAVGTTAVEIRDFLKSSYFDDPAAKDRRPKIEKASRTFPVPTSEGSYILSWIVILLVSVGIAYWFRPIPASFNIPARHLGAVLVTSTPDHVLLELDGNSLGNTPTRLKLDAGAHKYKATSPGHNAVTGEFTVTEDSDQSLYLDLPVIGTVRSRSDASHSSRTSKTKGAYQP